MDIIEKVAELQKLYQENINSGTSKCDTSYQDLYNRLEKDFEPLLSGAVYHYRWAGDRDDLRQVARMIFFQGLLAFQCEGVVYFEHYIKRKVYGDLRTYARRVGRNQQREKLTTVNEHGQSWIETTLVSEESIDTDIEWQSVISSCQLTEKERKILNLVYVSQYRFAEIARLWDADPSTIRKAHKRILNTINLGKITLVKNQ